MLAEFSIYPLDDAHLSEDIARVVDLLDESGLSYQLGPTSTSIEGEWQDVMSVIHRCHESVAGAGHSRIVTNIMIDDRRDGGHSLNEAVARVEQHRAAI
ncbi:MAG: thiamine-binding protein [Planctomycetota bacterium]|nr:MAG: thiamine-binding protein [Planctomycetota bacterium]REJ87740.1 MAG: thiamine-binding protein [Planctomycetota bacterium]REK27823.1 MAG: thiamine-binding protein [Planctomycetota bacterium]REK40277.1 MAG: thiamine-binding protein [Planctomycetota bacterium]